MKHLLGTGSLNWDGQERRSDRYGMVGLFNENSEDTKQCDASADLNLVRDLIGKRGKLIAKVIKQQQSTHIGDLFRGFSPSTPELGAELELGEGFLFVESLPKGAACYVGLSPLQYRVNDWLRPEILYQAHEQVVELYFEESKVNFDDL